MKEEFKRTTEALAKLQTHRSEGLYKDFLDLLIELQEDIRIANDYEDDVNQLFRNQGAIRNLTDLIDNMKRKPAEVKKPMIYDGAYTDI